MANDAQILKIAREFDEAKSRLDAHKARKQSLHDELASVTQAINDTQLMLDGIRQSLKDKVNE